MPSITHPPLTFTSQKGCLTHASLYTWQTLSRKLQTNGSPKSSMQRMGPALGMPHISNSSFLNSQVGWDSYIHFLHRQCVQQEAVRRLLRLQKSIALGSRSTRLLWAVPMRVAAAFLGPGDAHPKLYSYSDIILPQAQWSYIKLVKRRKPWRMSETEKKVTHYAPALLRP